MRQEIIKIYKFDELAEDVKEKVIEKYYDINIDYEWWESVFEDAKMIGLKIEEFNLDRGAYCRGKWIEDAEEAAEEILQEHGKECETYKDAMEFQKELKLSKETHDFYPQNTSEYLEFKDTDMYEVICEEFLKTLLEDYRIMLEKDYEWLTSEEAIREAIEANEWVFTKDGKLY